MEPHISGLMVAICIQCSACWVHKQCCWLAIICFYGGLIHKVSPQVDLSLWAGFHLVEKSKLQRSEETLLLYGPFYRIGASQSWKHLEINVFSPKLFMYVSCITSKVHISSSCTFNSDFVFSYSFGIFFLSQNLSLPKHNEISHEIKGYIDLLKFCLHLPCKYIFLKFYFSKFTGKLKSI